MCFPRECTSIVHPRIIAVVVVAAFCRGRCCLSSLRSLLFVVVVDVDVDVVVVVRVGVVSVVVVAAVVVPVGVHDVVC